MKQKRKVSVLIALMMLLTVFAVPSMAFGAEEDYDYEIAPAGSDSQPRHDRYLAIGGTVDLNIVSDPKGANVNQSDWTWKVEKSDSYFQGRTSALATIDQNGVLTAKGEGVVRITAKNKVTGASDEYSMNLGFIKVYEGYREEVRIYPNKTAKLMYASVYSDEDTYAIPTQVLLEKKPDNEYSEYSEWDQEQKAFDTKYQGTYPVTAIEKDAMSCDTAKKFIVPDTVKSIGSHAMGYKIVGHSSGDPAKRTYMKTDGVTIYGSSDNTAAAKYAKANGFTYKNMETGKTVTIKANVTNPKKVAGTKAKAGKKQMTVTWKRDKKADGYQITYSQSKNFKKGKKNVVVNKNKTTKKVIKNLKSGKKYYVKVRSYKKSGNKKIYGAYSKAKALKVK